jgi:hypothetical protein
MLIMVLSEIRQRGRMKMSHTIVDTLRQQFVSHPPGSPQAILYALKNSPRVSPEDADALDQAIKEGEIPVDWTSIFDEGEEEKP